MRELPLDGQHRRRGYGIVEFEGPAAAKAAVEKLELAELKGQQLVVRSDDSVVGTRGGATVYVGNLAPTTTWQHLREQVWCMGTMGILSCAWHVRRRPRGGACASRRGACAWPAHGRCILSRCACRAPLRAQVVASGVDPSQTAHVRVVADHEGRSMGYGFIDFRNAASADACIWMLHNALLEGRALFLRQASTRTHDPGACVCTCMHAARARASSPSPSSPCGRSAR